MSSVLVTPRRQPEHPCGCPGPCSEPSGPGARTRCSPLHFPAHPKAEWRGLPGGRFDPDRHRPRPLAGRDADLVRLRRPEPVSYTHLRAHETDSYLVCRLLLEKKKKKIL